MIQNNIRFLSQSRTRNAMAKVRSADLFKDNYKIDQDGEDSNGLTCIHGFCSRSACKNNARFVFIFPFIIIPCCLVA